MAQDGRSSTGRLTLKTVQTSEEQVDYSYDQWRHAQMRQMEQSYAETTGGARRHPAAA
ncbi:hypothetical protein [Erythrobacter donghaensis]|jgi:hypothetical protein|uniref:hypothetical protein n=1 Tax=Erythrobacter donghaensis TaxID=267135 RepID=UPI000AC6AA00|nr:hypothetical protein [Erythrobacter donghaensis]